jgi:hypothetical protein
MCSRLGAHRGKNVFTFGASTVTVRAGWFVFVGFVLVGFELVRFVFWVALHPEEVDSFEWLSWF